MELQPLLRLLWRRRILVVLGLVLSIAAAVKVAGGSGDGGGAAQVRVLLDTPRSQLIDAHPALVETLPWRANLFSKLLGTEPARRRIADEAGIPAAQLAVVDSQLLAPTVPASLPKTAAEAAAEVLEPYVLAVRSDGIVPLISIKALAPEPGAAARLAEAASNELKASAAPAGRPEDQGFSAERVTPIETRELAAGDSRAMAAAIALVLFGLWCAGVALLPALAASVRSVGASPRPGPPGESRA